MSKPVCVLAMDQARTRHVLADDSLDRLARVCDIPNPAPLGRFDDAGAAALLGAADILLTGWGTPLVGAAALRLAPRLRLVAHAAGTIRGIVDPVVFAAGIAVSHAAEANAVPVAEYALAAILSAGKRTRRFQALCRDGDRDGIRALMDAPIGNNGLTVGIIGASRIGRRVVGLLSAFEVTVLLHDPTLRAALPGTTLLPLPDLLAASDVVSVHAPSLPGTRHMLDASALAQLRTGATLINTARGALIDQDALEAELVSGRIDAVLDVTEPEVLERSSPLLRLPNCVITPHIAGAIGLERSRLGSMAVDEVVRFVSGKALRHAIKIEDLEVMA